MQFHAHSCIHAAPLVLHALDHFEHSIVIEIHNRILLNFYPGLQTSSPLPALHSHMCTYMWHASTSEEFFSFHMASLKSHIQRSHLRKTPNTEVGHVDWLSGRLSKFLILDHDLVPHFTASLLLSGPCTGWHKQYHSACLIWLIFGCGLFTLAAMLTFLTGNHT